ncbi:hypothetical protein H5410_049055 [Solanum commersonii]|uniref:Uncharacterized protein n=1 Tax=Solanum commersonii TaxID=4109 RepID=A0A9J5XLA6_SOLCO|nr:hypothetical protein H5410_049055 [Solanum commersonii]
MNQLAMVDTTITRPLANYHSSVWEDYFLSYTPQLTEISSQEKLEIEKLKEKVKQMWWKLLIKNKNEDDNNLYVVALRFRLVRGQRHYMSSELNDRIINTHARGLGFVRLLTSLISNYDDN